MSTLVWQCCTGDDTRLPPERSSTTRTSEAHLAVRFADNIVAGHRITVLLDGQDVTARCVELVAGEHGWVELHQLDDHGYAVIHSHGCTFHTRACPCHPASEIRHGNVRVQRRPGAGT